MSEWLALMAGAGLLGLVGSGHCLGMCGGIAGALGMTSPSSRTLPRALSSLLYSLGRVSSYALLGLLAGALGQLTSVGLGLGPTMRIAAGILIVLLGLQLAGLRVGFDRLERVGLAVWRRLRPALAWIGSPDAAWKCLALGALWGWLPCGLVYSALAAAAATGTATGGALFMACFGLGTMPALLFATGMAGRLGETLRGRGARRVVGVTLVGLGLWAMVGGVLAGHGPDHAGHRPQGGHAEHADPAASPSADTHGATHSGPHGGSPGGHGT